MARTVTPRTEAGLLFWAHNAAPKLMAFPLRYGQTDARAQEFSDKTDAFATAFASAYNPSTRTRVTIAAKDAAADALRAAAGIINDYAQADANVSVEDKLDVGLPVHKAPAPRPAPAVGPELDVMGVDVRTVHVRLRDAENPLRRGKPANVATAMIFVAVGDVAPQSLKAWRQVATASRTTWSFDLPADVLPGTKFYVTACWCTSTQKTSPAAEPVAAYAQYGGVSSAA